MAVDKSNFCSDKNIINGVCDDGMVTVSSSMDDGADVSRSF